MTGFKAPIARGLLFCLVHIVEPNTPSLTHRNTTHLAL